MPQPIMAALMDQLQMIVTQLEENSKQVNKANSAITRSAGETVFPIPKHLNLAIITAQLVALFAIFWGAAVGL